MTLDPAEDPEAYVNAYRANDARLDAATDELVRERFTRIRRSMEQAWAAWQCDDCLREMAFGEPSE